MQTLKIFSSVLLAWTTHLVAFPVSSASGGKWSENAVNEYAIRSDIVYTRAGGQEVLADVYTPANRQTPVPTLLYFHAGGWVGGDRTSGSLMLLPFLEKGWAVVNATYRKAQTSLAPAAVEDARCALRWIHNNAEDYGFDLDRVVLSGRSAGAHLALMAGLLDSEDGFDYLCPGAKPSKVAAVVSWFAITDVADLLEGENRQAYAVAWLGNPENRLSLAQRVSPLHYVRPNSPPILSIHGDRDTVAPYSHAVRLHERLAKAGVDHLLHTVPEGGHANFDPSQTHEAYRVLWSFLEERLQILPK